MKNIKTFENENLGANGTMQGENSETLVGTATTVPMKFGISQNIKSRVVQVCTPQLLNQALDDPKVAQVCAEIRDAWEMKMRGEMRPEDFETLKGTLKKQLPILTPHATFKNGRRLNADAIPSGLCMYDLDHIPDPAGRWAEIAPRRTALGIVMAHITPSHEGLRLIFVVPQGMSLARAQAWMAEQLGDKTYDSSVKDYARSSFVVPRDYVLWMDEQGLFERSVRPERSEGSESSETSESSESSEQSEHSEQSEPTHPTPPLRFPNLVEVLEEQMGGAPDHGSRNNFIFSMACHLRYVCNDDPEWIARVLPTYGEERGKWMATIRSACSRNQTPRMPRIMQRTLRICKERQEAEENESVDPTLPPPMPKVLPPLIRLLVSKTPDIYKPAVAHAVFPALGAHLWQTRFRYIDNVEHEATLMNVLMAGTGAGKNCISEPINRIMADIRMRDAKNLRREREWKREVQTKGANKDKRHRPEGLVIQEIDPDMTNAAFVQRLADADERFLYAKLNEIDQFDALKTSARSKAQFQIMCLAFDPGNVYGQTRVGTGSVSERVCIRFNWNASTTVQKGQRYFQGVLTDGPISRINFCTIPEREIGAPMPIYGTYDEAFDENLRPYIERLNAARGVVTCAKARTLAKKLIEECADFSRLSQSRVYENLSYRANVIAYLKAMVLYVAQGEKWDKTTENFIRWSLQYDLWCKMQYFGESISEHNQSCQIMERKGPQNLLNLLPDTFTREEAQQLRERLNIHTGSLTNMLNNWKQRGYIVQIAEAQTTPPAHRKYEKTEQYKERGV